MTDTTQYPETDGTQTTDVPHERYTNTTRASYPSQQEVANAWADGKYPAHNGGTLYSSPNFTGHQNTDGTGRLMHYRTREAIRTQNGLIISNAQCWSAGFAHCSAPKERDGTVPLSAVEGLLDRQHSVYDITTVTTGHEGTVVEIDNGAYGFAIGRDSTIINGGSHFIFRLTAEEVAVITPGMFRELLLPEEVQRSNRDVVDSREYTKTQLSEEEGKRHELHGGHLTESQSKWRDTLINRQHYRADLQGRRIIRQGEWFFIPIKEWDLPVTVTDGVPRECEACEGTRFDVSFTASTCKKCGHVHTKIESDPDRRLGNHRPRDSVFDGEYTYVRGMVRHSANDHHSINLGETWHMAVTHDRDVSVFSTSGPGGMRGD